MLWMVRWITWFYVASDWVKDWDKVTKFLVADCIDGWDSEEYVFDVGVMMAFMKYNSMPFVKCVKYGCVPYVYW